MRPDQGHFDRKGKLTVLDDKIFTRKVLSENLKSFKSYQDYLNYTKPLLKLESDEYRGLYNVLVKLENIGEDPVDCLSTLRKNSDEKDRGELIRFMIAVDHMDMEEIKQAA